MRNRCGYFAAPDTGLTNEVLVGVGYMLWPSGTVVAVMHVTRLKLPNIPGPLKKSSPVNVREMCIFYVIESRELRSTNGRNMQTLRP